MASQVPPPATITAEAAKSEEWIERLPAIGTLIASQGVDVASQVAGIVTEIGFESGQDVPRGKKLVQLDIAVETADLASAEATLREADVAYKRQTDLLRKSVASEANVDAALAKRDTAAAMACTRPHAPLSHNAAAPPPPVAAVAAVPHRRRRGRLLAARTTLEATAVENLAATLAGNNNDDGGGGGGH